MTSHPGVSEVRGILLGSFLKASYYLVAHIRDPLFSQPLIWGCGACWVRKNSPTPPSLVPRQRVRTNYSLRPEHFWCRIAILFLGGACSFVVEKNRKPTAPRKEIQFRVQVD